MSRSKISAEHSAQAEAGKLFQSQRPLSAPDSSPGIQGRRGSMMSDATQLVPGRPNATAANAVNWQLRFHSGFIPSFVSSILHAPIYECHERWKELGCRLREKRAQKLKAATQRPARGRQVLILLGSQDPIILKDELLEDAQNTLGTDIFEAVVLEAGHELPISMPEDVVAAMSRFWGDEAEAMDEMA